MESSDCSVALRKFSQANGEDQGKGSLLEESYIRWEGLRSGASTILSHQPGASQGLHSLGLSVAVNPKGIAAELAPHNSVPRSSFSLKGR